MKILEIFQENNIYKVYNLLSKKRKKQFFVIVILSFISSIVELASIGSVVPFVTILLEPNEAITNSLFLKNFQFQRISQQNLAFTLIFIILALTSGLTRSLLLYLQSIFAFNVGGDLSSQIYFRVISQDYKYHLSNLSSELIATITSKTDEVVGSVITPALKLFSSILVITLIASTAFVANPFLSITIIISLSLVYVVFSKLVKKRLLKNAKLINANTNSIVLNVQESIGGIRDVIIDESQLEKTEIFRNIDTPRRTAMAVNQFLGQIPKYIIETLAIFGLATAGFILSLNVESNLTNSLPVIVAVAFGIQKALPLAQQIYRSWSLLKGSADIISDTLAYFSLSTELIEDHRGMKIPEPSFVKFKDVSFKYDNQQNYILEKVSLNLQFGTIVGIVGSTGSGKSTFLDLFMGLLEPTEGKITVDNVVLCSENLGAWRKKIAHVPQTVFIYNSTLESNITKVKPGLKFDEDLFQQSIEVACLGKKMLSQNVGQLPEKRKLGESGNNLSGGERQRIGIARAVYKQKNIVVLDEATSALDIVTETKILNNIKKQLGNKLILMVSHRLDSLSCCHQILEIKEGRAQLFSDVNQYLKTHIGDY